MRVSGVTAAGLATAIVLLSGCGGQAVAHTCSATDRLFIRQASLHMATVGSSGRDYLRGGGRAKDVIADTKRAAAVVMHTKPTDPSLERTRRLLGPMFNEYGRAILARERKRDPGPHILRAYGLANFAHDALATAAPALKDRGCDVTGLL